MLRRAFGSVRIWAAWGGRSPASCPSRPHRRGRAGRRPRHRV